MSSEKFESGFRFLGPIAKNASLGLPKGAGDLADFPSYEKRGSLKGKFQADAGNGGCESLMRSAEGIFDTLLKT